MRAWIAAVVGLVLVSACDKGPSSAGPASSVPTEPSSAPSTATSAPAVVASATASAAPAPPPDAIIAQHVLVAYRGAKRAPKGVTRSKADAKARAAEALAKIRAGTPFEDVVKEYSDDTGSVDRMGSLGKFTRDAMDPAFAAAAFALAVGQVSDPVETPFGFHIIKRTQ
ncbi:MAG TPA: peptidylprolyl isomerase [Polyangiaceae bacterium]|nr:peptidylprolyl isomerase [Polyangiaceae bacterium]